MEACGACIETSWCQAPKDKTSQKIEVSFPLFIKPHTHVHFFPPPSTTAENRDLKGPISEISTEPQLSAFRRSSIPPDLTCRAQHNLKTSSHWEIQATFDATQLQLQGKTRVFQESKKSNESRLFIFGSYNWLAEPSDLLSFVHWFFLALIEPETNIEVVRITRGLLPLGFQ